MAPINDPRPAEAYAFLPPSAQQMPKPALDAATRGANMFNAYALTGVGRNFLAHALVGLQREGWLREKPSPPAGPAGSGVCVCCRSPYPRIVYRNYRDQPFCSPCAEGECRCSGRGDGQCGEECSEDHVQAGRCTADRADAPPPCVCGQPDSPGVRHRTDGPCYIQDDRHPAQHAGHGSPCEQSPEGHVQAGRCTQPPEPYRQWNSPAWQLGDSYERCSFTLQTGGGRDRCIFRAGHPPHGHTCVHEERNVSEPHGAEDAQAEELTLVQGRLKLAHTARRAKEHQLDDIRRALCDVGLIEDDDPYSHADLAYVIRQTEPAFPGVVTRLRTELAEAEDKAAGRMDQVRAAHPRGPGLLRTPSGMLNADDVCGSCHVQWPCPTGRILTQHTTTQEQP